METISLICNSKSCNSTNLCPVRHKATRCLKSSNYKVYKLGKHDIEPEPIKNTPKGITPKVKQLIQSLIFDYDITE